VLVYGDHDAKLKLKPHEVRAGAKHTSVSAAVLTAVGSGAWAEDRVPAALVPPRGRSLPTGRVDTVGGQIDLGATLLHYLGVPQPASFVGLPLVEERRGFAARYDGSAADDDVVVSVHAGGKSRCRARADPKARGDQAACDALRARAKAQLDVSERITLMNLAADLSRR
jgi:arylsulfatase A-like enzyme